MRVRYCPVDGRVTEKEFEANLLMDNEYGWHTLYCDDCWRWFFRLGRKTAKRSGES